MLCHRGKHAADIIYSLHRLQTPMRRIADKGSDTPIGEQFEAISWDQAYALIAEKFNQIKAESGPEATAIYTARGAFELSL